MSSASTLTTGTPPKTGYFFTQNRIFLYNTGFETLLQQDTNGQNLK
jgi:hypothetical protein